MVVAVTVFATVAVAAAGFNYHLAWAVQVYELTQPSNPHSHTTENYRTERRKHKPHLRKPSTLNQQLQTSNTSHPKTSNQQP